jgi:tetratricopeptide (TPR) repeat protein
MAGFNILKWLYKHSPVNFYSITENGETVIKSINNTFTGYKFDKIFSEEQIGHLRIIIKRYKRLSALAILLFYFAAIYGLLFNHYEYFIGILSKVIFFIVVIVVTLFMLYIASKLFEKYLANNYGKFEKVHFPSSNFIENQSYKDFKFELIKITVLVFLLCLVYFSKIYLFFGSPYETSLKLISNQKYEDAIKVTSLWAKIMPMNPQIYSMRGFARFNSGDYAGAIEDYDRAFNLEEDEFKSMNFDNKIYIRYYLKDYDTAIKEFDKEINKNTAEKNSFLWDKAQFLYNIGEYEKSLEMYNDLILASEEDHVYLFPGRLYFERAQVYKKLGDNKKAQEDLNESKDQNLILEFQNPIPEPNILFEGSDFRR